MKTAVAPLSEILRSSFRFIIPLFQRRYSWSRKQWTKLWDDLLSLYLREDGEGVPSPHFMGALVYGEAITGGPTQQTIPEYEIIDGQQRLITLSILVAAIRDVIGALPEQRDFLNYTYLWHQAIGSRPDQLRITPSQHDRANYEQIMLGNTPSPSQSLIVKAYDFFCDALRSGISEPTELVSDDEGGLDGSQDVSILQQSTLASLPRGNGAAPFDYEKILKITTRSLVVVTISEVPTESAYQVFSTINATGLPLAQVDLLRNAIFMLLPLRGAAIYADEWQPMEELLGDDLETFFLTDLIRTGANVTRGTIYAQFMENARKFFWTEEKLSEELSKIRQRATVYNTIRRGTMPITIKGKKVPQKSLDCLSRLREWGDVPTLPMTLEAVLRWSNELISSDELDLIISAIESLLVRRFVIGVPPNDLRSAFVRAMHSVQNTSNFVDGVLELLNDDRLRWPSDSSFRKALIEQPLYPRGAKYTGLLLKGIAVKTQGHECPVINIGTGNADYSVEHILPQTLNNEWIADLQSWGEGQPYELQVEKGDVIGNLTITAYNSSLSNRRFSEKKNLIRDHLFLKISRSILENEQWTRDSIDDRSAELADVALELWPKYSA